MTTSLCQITASAALLVVVALVATVHVDAQSQVVGAQKLGNAGVVPRCPAIHLVQTDALVKQCSDTNSTGQLCEGCLSMVMQQIIPQLVEGSKPTAEGIVYTDGLVQLDLKDEAAVLSCLLPVVPELRTILPNEDDLDYRLINCPNLKSSWDHIHEYILMQANKTINDLTSATNQYVELADVAFSIYSRKCYDVQLDHGIVWSSHAMNPHNCIFDDTTCKPECLHNMKTFFEEFTAEGCEIEWLEGLQNTYNKGPEALEKESADIEQITRMYQALVPAVDDTMENLACNKNEYGDFCLSFTKDLPDMLSAANTAYGKSEYIGASPFGGSMGDKCDFFRKMGCCAPLLVSVGLQAVAAFDSALGVMIPISSVDSIISQMNDVCYGYFSDSNLRNISVDACENMEQLNDELNADEKSPTFIKKYAQNPKVIASLVIVGFILIGAAAGCAYKYGRKEERASGKMAVEMQQDSSSDQYPMRAVEPRSSL